MTKIIVWLQLKHWRNKVLTLVTKIGSWNVCERSFQTKKNVLLPFSNVLNLNKPLWTFRERLNSTLLNRFKRFNFKPLWTFRERLNSTLLNRFKRFNFKPLETVWKRFQTDWNVSFNLVHNSLFFNQLDVQKRF